MAVEKILRFEGLKLGGGSTMGCERTKMVYSPALGRTVRRCAQFSKGGSMLGAFRIPGVDIGQIKDTLITGGVAVGGAVVTGKAVAYLLPMVKIDPASKWRPVIEIGVGIGLGIVVSKLTKKADLGAAFAIGPVVVNGLRLVSGILATGNGIGRIQPPVYSREQLASIIEQSGFPPEGMYDTQYSEQEPGWMAAA